MPCSHLHSQLWNGPHCMINMAALTFMQCSACYFLFPASPNPLLSLTAHYGQIGYDLQCKSSHSSPSNMGHFESLGACSEDQNVQNVADRYEAYRMDTSWLFYTGHLYVWLSDCPVLLSQTLLARKGSYPKRLINYLPCDSFSPKLEPNFKWQYLEKPLRHEIVMVPIKKKNWTLTINLKHWT